MPAARNTPVHPFRVGLARAAGGAILFSLPLLMTMEMWRLGYYIGSLRLALLVAVSIPMLVALSHFSGFEDTFRVKDDAVDAFVALAVGFVTAAACLALLGVIRGGMNASEIITTTTLQAVPGSIGALLAQSQLGNSPERPKEAKRRVAGYWGDVFLMGVGALFMALPIAPTQEIELIAYRLTPALAALLAAVSLVVMHGFVYAAQFKGSPAVPRGSSGAGLFARFTAVGYAVALLVSAYTLWSFDRFGTTAALPVVVSTVVLAFPAAIGAAAARLIL